MQYVTCILMNQGIKNRREHGDKTLWFPKSPPLLNKYPHDLIIYIISLKKDVLAHGCNAICIPFTTKTVPINSCLPLFFAYTIMPCRLTSHWEMRMEFQCMLCVLISAPSRTLNLTRYLGIIIQHQ